MAVNQSDHLTPGLTGLLARIERLGEPGQPRAYWDGTANAWAVAPASHVEVIPDADQPGLYLTQVPTSSTLAWPDGLYRKTIMNPALSGDQVVKDPYDFWMAGGDDGSALGYPSAMIPWLGGVLQIWDARFLTPTLPAGPPPATH